MAEDDKTENLDIDRLLREWRWLCPQPLAIVDRNVFGDLFLRDEAGRVYMLNIGSGEFTLIANSVPEFRRLATNPEKQRAWFQVEAAMNAQERGLIPGYEQGIGFSIPVVFAEGGGLDSAYIVDLYELVGTLGDLHRQIAEMPDGAKVRLVVKNDRKTPSSREFR